MLSIVRIPENASVGADLLASAKRALEVLTARPGFVRGRVGRSTDDGGGWVLLTEWASVGAWRRALSSYEVKVAATQLLGQAVDESTAYEVLLDVDDTGAVAQHPSDRADAGLSTRRPPSS